MLTAFRGTAEAADLDRQRLVCLYFENQTSLTISIALSELSQPTKSVKSQRRRPYMNMMPHTARAQGCVIQ